MAADIVEGACGALFIPHQQDVLAGDTHGPVIAGFGDLFLSPDTQPHAPEQLVLLERKDFVGRI